MISQFEIKGKPCRWNCYGQSHSNQTYLVTCDAGLPFALAREQEAGIIVEKLNSG